MLEGVSVHPVGHNPERVTFTADRDRERLSPLERHHSCSLLTAPLIAVFVIPDHNVLIKAWIIVQSDARGMAEIHIEPCCTGVNSPLDSDGPACSESSTDGVPVWDRQSYSRKPRLCWESRL